ncbi:MAG TPA: ABC transporter permease [Bacillales bacterium]|nr:ABC transporter permease [Bacillales bacterium]
MANTELAPQTGNELPKQESQEKEYSPLAEAIKGFRKNRLGVAGALVILIFILLAVFAGIIEPNGYNNQLLTNALKPPSADHWLGTDDFGRDIFTRIIYGARTSLWVGFFSVLGSIVVGSLLGIIAGFYGKFVDTVISRIFDIILAFPSILLAIGIVAVLGPSLQNALIAIATINIPRFGRLIRSRVLSLKEEEYVMAARSIGMRDSRILFRHILPNSVAPIIVQSSLGIGTAILDAAALGFLGLGAQPPTPEWGAMLADSAKYISQAPWTVFFPGLAIMLTVLGFNLLGDGLRDALDPRMKN